MASKVIKQLRDFPSVEELLQSKKLADEVLSVPRPVAAEVVKQVVADMKKNFKSEKKPVTLFGITSEVTRRINAYKLREISKVVNATGVVVHTNLGRAPLSERIFDAVKKTVVGYGNIEFDLETAGSEHVCNLCHLAAVRDLGFHQIEL